MIQAQTPPIPHDREPLGSSHQLSVRGNRKRGNPPADPPATVSKLHNGGGQPAGWKATYGRLWFPTVAGPVVVDPAKITLNQLLPQVVIEDLLVDKMAIERRAVHTP
jgi:hypothetical protein